MAQPQKGYAFGPFKLDTEELSLYREDELVPLTPKVFDTLLALVSDSGRTLSKEELIKRVWPDAIVGEGSLSQNILVLRKVLDPYFPGESPIATFPKRGYRFTAMVTGLGEPPDVALDVAPQPPSIPQPPPNRWRLWVAGGTAALAVVVLGFFVFRATPSVRPTNKRRSVAVLALKNLTAKPEVDWYSTALAETITSELRPGGDLRVISSDSVRRMQQELSLPGMIITKSQIADIRNDLGCDLVLSGSYLTIGDKIRVELLLSDARTSDTIASITDTDDQNHLLDLVSRTGQQLRSKLGVQPSPTAGVAAAEHSMSADARANRFYFDGLSALKLRDGPEAERQLSLAVETDPAFALAHSALSETWHDLGYSARALNEAKIALDLSGNSQSREDHLAVEGQYYECLFDWKKASETYASLWRFFPDNIEYGLKLVQVQYAAGQPAEALKVLSQLRAQPAPDNQDPRIDLFESVGEQLSGHYQRAYDAASQAGQKAQRAKARILLAQARVKQGLDAARLGRPTEARQHYAEARQIFEALGDLRDQADVLTLDAESLRAMGQTGAAILELESALGMSRQIGFTRLTNRILAAYSNLLLNTGSLDKARQACEEALASNNEINDVGTSYTVLMTRGGIARAQGRYSEARADLVEAVRITRQAGYRLEMANAGAVLGVIDAGLGHLPEAGRELEEAIRQKRELGNRGSLAASLGSLAVVLRAEGDLAGARRTAGEQCAIVKSLEQRSGLLGCRMTLARILLDEGKLAEARTAVTGLMADLATGNLPAGDLPLLAMLQFETGDVNGARESVANAQRKLPHPEEVPDRSLPVALAAAVIARSVPQLKEVEAKAQKISLVSVALEARLALAGLQPGNDAGRLTSEADQKGFKLIAKKANGLANR